MLNDFFVIFFWWFLLFGLGAVTFPLTYFLFKKFFDCGYAFAKIIGLLLVSYLVWFLGSLKILPFSNPIIWLTILLLGGFNFWLKKDQNLNLKKIIQENWRIFVLEEILFFASLAFWSFIRGFQPSIQGLEKFMDYGFVNSILRSQYFPPIDMWLAGETINYYYFGHLMTAVLTKLSGIDSAITYNLMIAAIFGLAFTAAFSLGGNLIFLATENKKQKISKGSKFLIRNSPALGKPTRPRPSQDEVGKARPRKFVILGGFLSAFLLTLGGNSHSLYWLITQGNFKTYWYPDATRFIVEKFGAGDNTIHEFPIYSFVVADLHGHLLNLPLVLLFLGLTLSILFCKKISLHLCIFASLLLGVFYMTNAWDFPIYFLVFGAALFWFNYSNYGLKAKTFLKTLWPIGACLFLAALFSLPFHLNFESIAQGISLVDFHSPPWMLLVLWGFPLIITASFIIFLVKTTKISRRVSLIERLRYWLSGKKVSKTTSLNYFLLSLLIIAWFLILVPEFLYVKDIYIHSHQRANTMFKLTYQSFVMFSIASGYIIVKILTSLKSKSLRFLFIILCSLFIIPIFIYPYFAVRSYYGLKTYHGLYGLNYLQNLYPDDYQAVVWLKENITGRPVIVEAVGESYTDFARVSANTGFPTILGWRVHEWLWRGSFDEAGKRTEEVKTIYESPDLVQTKQLLNTYRAHFIFVGNLEREQYPNLQEEKFDQLGEIIFSSGETKVYQLTSLVTALPPEGNN